MEKPNGQICNVFGFRSNKNRKPRIRSFSVLGPNIPSLQDSDTPDLYPGSSGPGSQRLHYGGATMLKKILPLLIISVVILGCYSRDLNLKIRFSQTEGLKANDSIIFEKNYIGKVDAISYSERGDYIADVKIDKGFKKAITEHSRFFIINDPAENGRKAIEMIKVAEGGVPLEKGAIIVGSTRFSLLLGQMEEEVGKVMSEINHKINKLAGEIKQIPESGEIKKLENYLKQLKEKMDKEGRAFREKMQKELLPWLQEEIEKLKERLRKFGREKEVKPLEVKMEELRKI